MKEEKNILIAKKSNNNGFKSNRVSSGSSIGDSSGGQLNFFIFI